MSDAMDDDAFFAAFVDGTIDPKDFDHRAHLRAAWCAVRTMPFLDACVAMRDGIGLLARRAGKSALYHETLTIAFVALVAERVDADDEASWDAWIATHPELFDRALLRRWWSDEQLAGEEARRRLVLPTPRSPSSAGSPRPSPPRTQDAGDAG